MKILITGAAGFIGFNLANYLLNKSTHIITGVDNLNNYYSIALKNKRLAVLKKSKKFNFLKIDIKNKNNVEKIFEKNKFDIVFNLAAQAGVRYSIDNPAAFIDNNILGFYNILDASIKFKVKRLLYASSSSVYGDSKNFPLKENQKIAPKNIYGLSKKINEEISQVTSLYNDIQLIGLRFFTVYGEWGRPDMFMMKYLKSSFDNNSKFYLNNFGKHVRDWTYVKDICQILNLLIKINSKKKHVVYNICSNKPVKLMSIIDKIDVLTQKKAKITKRILQKGDIYKTHGSNTLIKNITKFKNFTSIDIGLRNTVNWYIKNKI